MPRAVPGFFFQFPSRRVDRLLVRVHQATGKLPSPEGGYEPMAPQHEHLVVIVQQDDERHAMQPDHRTPVPLTTGHLNVNLPESHPLVVVYGPLPKRPPSPRFITLCAGHTLDSNTCRKCAEPIRTTRSVTAATSATITKAPNTRGIDSTDEVIADELGHVDQMLTVA
jgi:hypothetical protein